MRSENCCSFVPNEILPILGWDNRATKVLLLLSQLCSPNLAGVSFRQLVHELDFPGVFVRSRCLFRVFLQFTHEFIGGLDSPPPGR